MIKFSSKRFAFLAAVAAAALTVSAQKANANPTTVTVNEYGASSGLSGVSSGQQADSVYSDGGPSAPDITTTAYFFSTLSTTDVWGANGNGWVDIENSLNQTVEAVQFDNATVIAGVAYETMYVYNLGDLPPAADYSTADYVVVHETNGVATYAPGTDQPGYGYDAISGAPAPTSDGSADQLHFNFIVPDGANTLCLLGAALVGLACVRRKFLAC
jgi:hypothetical protein